MRIPFNLDWRVLLAIFLLSLGGAALRNHFSAQPLAWLGSPTVLEKPEGY